MQKYQKEILVSDYFDIHTFYSKIYGKNRTIILMQIGSFHECYCTDTLGINLMDLSQTLDVVCTQKNKSLPLSKSNPKMLGFPTYVTHTFINKLIDLNYTIVLIDQVSEPPKPKREITGIYSPATYIQNNTNNNLNLVSIVLDKIIDRNKIEQLCIGISSYDLSTGKGCIFECYSKNNDVLLALDDTLRFLDNNPPREIILENNLLKDDTFANMKVDEILAYLNINENNVYTIKIVNHKKISYQKKLFEDIYKIETNVDIIEYLELTYISYARLSLILLLDYVINHQPLLLKKLQLPILFSSSKYLYLGNRALEQLDVNTKNDTNLFNIINFTKTIIGKRYLLSQLTNPLIDIEQLNARYNTISIIIEKNISDKIISYLEDIHDLDKLIRKLEINIISPFELYYLYISFHQITKLFAYFKDENLLEIFNIEKKLVKNVNKLETFIKDNFILDKIKDINFNNFNETEYSFYNKGIKIDIDNIQDDINSSRNFMDLLVKKLESYIDDKRYFNKMNDDKSYISLKFNERDGHYMLITNRRCEILKNRLKDIKYLEIGTLKLNIDELEFNILPKSANTKISCTKFKEISNELVEHKIKLAKLLKEEFKNDMTILLNKHLHNISNKIAYIDFINSGAICTIKNHYSKPIIENKEYSFLNAIELRHPIIEKISNTTVYIPHNIALGCDQKQDGILLYGINSSGKSTLMKSIGLNIILAQIGYYTASTSFKYNPYHSLFTRIKSGDNMFRGLSSFTVEMIELMAILKRNNNRTLVLGDELCSGSEIKSATVIICYMLETLSNNNTSFITATHIHDINNVNSIKELSRVKTKHLKITFDEKNDLLIYDRNLLDGQGETFYGLLIAKYLMKDKNFNEKTNSIFKEYENISEKKSNYNSNVYMNKCTICDSTQKLETHHIVWQKDFDKNEINNKLYYLQKNNPANLVILCMSCHDKVDRNEIKINGWINTSNGRKFDYEIITNLENNSENNDVIIYIKELKNKITNATIIQNMIKEKFNKKISLKKISSILSQ